VSTTACKLVVLVSGNGSNLQAIIDQINKSSLNATICGVISDKPDAYGLARAKQHGIPAIHVIPDKGEQRDEYDRRLQDEIDTLAPDWIILAGFMRILSDHFVNHYLGRLINIHPSLLPKYKGLNTHQRALEAGETIHGASVHFVTPELDDGPVIMQAGLEVNPGETTDDLKQRIHELEHKLYPRVIDLLCQRRIVYTDRVILFDHQPIEKPLLLDDPLR
jgi:phosphoribosylglycinamide formyltransferase-1